MHKIKTLLITTIVGLFIGTAIVPVQLPDDPTDTTASTEETEPTEPGISPLDDGPFVE